VGGGDRDGEQRRDQDDREADGGAFRSHTLIIGGSGGR
jgi:hypothetical protein